MELAVDNFRGFVKSTKDFVTNLIQQPNKSSRRNPIEILKRLQREAFSDLMKLRDRQDKVERMLSFYKTSKGGPFQETRTVVRGEVDVLGALMMLDNFDLQSSDALGRAGIMTGIDSRFTFETSIQQKDMLVAEFVASQKGKGSQADHSGSSLSLAKVLYVANVTDWFSLVAIPVGAQCRDVRSSTNSFHQVKKGLTDFSTSGPPLLNQHNGSAIGLSVIKSNVIASLAQFVSGLDMQPGFSGVGHCFSTFGKIVCHLPKGTKFSILGLLQVPKSSNQHVNLGSLTIPLGFFKKCRDPETLGETSTLPMEIRRQENVSAGSLALMLESELDESAKIQGWIEMKKSSPRYLKWAVNMSDDSEDEFGWGMSLSGMIDGLTSWDHFQVESYIKLNLGKGFSLQPGIAYVMDGTGRIPALMLRSNWSL